MDPSLSPAAITAWESLASAFGSLPTQDAPWALAGLSTLPGEPRILSLGEPAAAIAPLVARGVGLEQICGRDLGEPSDLLCDSPESLDQLAGTIAATGRALTLERIPAASPSIEALRSALGRRGSVRTEAAAGHPTIALGEQWAEPGGGLSSSRRSALRRSRRKAEKMGEIAVELLTPGAAELDELLDECWSVEARSWKGEAGTAVVFAPRMKEFFGRYAGELAARGRLRIDLLRIDGRAIAMQFGMRWRNRHWLFKIGYDEAFKAGSPGQILLAESVAAAARDGLESYELLGSRDTWTDVWTKDVNECVRLIAVPRTPQGALGGAVVRWRTSVDLNDLVRKGKRRARSIATSRYVAGPELNDALREEAVYSAAGYRTAIGFWNGTSETPEEVRAEARKAAESLPPESELAIKLVSLGGDGEHLDELLATCTGHGITLHIDALGADSAEQAQATARRLAELAPGQVGCTLPGRWPRSVADAAALRSSGLRVRVIKGEIEDPTVAESDLSEGFMEVVEALAGGECHVEVATQDAPLAEAALTRLQATGTSCELQVLHGMRTRPAVAAARTAKVPVRVYIPYGTGRLPYTREDLQRRPALFGVLARDLLVPGARRPPGT